VLDSNYWWLQIWRTRHCWNEICTIQQQNFSVEL